MGLTHIKLLTYGAFIALTSALIGCVMAFFAKGREAVFTLTLALICSTLIGNALVHVAMRRPIDLGWMLWSFTDPLAIVCGGVIVRKIRSAPARPLSST